MPASYATYCGLGAFCLFTPPCAGGDLDLAEDYLKEALDFDGDHSAVYTFLAMAQQVKGNRKWFKIYLGRALKVNGENKTALKLRDNSGKFSYVAGKHFSRDEKN